MHGLNWVDYTLIAIVVLSAVISFFRGFIREAISLVVWVLGVLLALKFSASFQVYLPSFISDPLLRYGVAFVILFILIFIVGIVVNVVAQAFVHKVGLSLADRLLGLFFGVVRGMLVSAVFIMFLNVGFEKESVTLARSRLALGFEPMVVWLEAFLPEQMQQISRWVQLPGKI